MKKEAKPKIRRPYPRTFDFSELEDEWMARKSFELGISKSALLRSGVFPSVSVMQKEVGEFRQSQKGANIWTPGTPRHAAKGVKR